MLVAGGVGEWRGRREEGGEVVGREAWPAVARRGLSVAGLQYAML